jgi:hypothetical protein
MSFKKEYQMIHNTPKRTPPHKQTPEQEQTHKTQHTTTPGHLGEEHEASCQHLRRRHEPQHTARCKANRLLELLLHGTVTLKLHTRTSIYQKQRGAAERSQSANGEQRRIKRKTIRKELTNQQEGQS